MIRACIKVDLPEPVRPAMQDVLRRALAEREVLPLGRARLAERHVDPAAAVARPPGARGRADELEGDLDALGVLRRGADLLDLPRGELGGRRRVEDRRIPAEFGVVPDQAAAGPSQVRWSQYGRSSSSEKPGGAAWTGRRRPA